MDAHKALITNIFNNSTLVEVPFFQRSYVWKEDLWGRLLEDMEFVVKTKKPHFLVDKAVEDSGKVPKEFKQQMKNWIHDLVSTMSTKGWNNVPDMTLSILYGKSGLKDMNQLITYQYEADSTNRQWYSVL